jgi:hypothetical protein
MGCSDLRFEIYLFLWYSNARLKILAVRRRFLEMNVASNDVIVSVKPMRITRAVSVILNGVVLSKLAEKNSHDVDAMADTLMANLSDRIQRHLPFHEISLVEHSLRQEIKQRIRLLPRAV